MKLSPFSNSLKKKLKLLFDLIISKIGSDGDDFPRIIVIALFRGKIVSRISYHRGNLLSLHK